jgi:hypothetical protein
MTGALKVGDPRTWWFDALEQLAARPLVLRPEHVAAVHALPPVHKDPTGYPFHSADPNLLCRLLWRFDAAD